MKRSEINARLQEAVAFLDSQNFHLPKWAYWSPQDWKAAGDEADEVRKCMLGWDLTDFGKGDYDACGLLLFTIRNGRPDVAQAGGKDYCEKMLLIGEDQLTPTHFHWAKMEDIINRGGGNLVLKLWNADPDSEQKLDTPVTVSIDGIEWTYDAGAEVVLEPGESITLPPFMYHLFYAEKGAGPVLGGEVSRVNDDANDNRFAEPLPRFPQIEEDAEPVYLLCTEYPEAN